MRSVGERPVLPPVESTLVLLGIGTVLGVLLDGRRLPDGEPSERRPG